MKADKHYYVESFDAVEVTSFRLGQSPFANRYVTDETVFGVYCDRLFPLKLTDNEDPVPLYWRLRRDVLLYDVPEKPLEINGPDAAKLLERVLACRVETLPVGRCRYGIACREDGTVLMDGVVMRLSEGRFWYVKANGEFESWLAANAIGLDVEVSDPDSRVLQIQGPKSLALMVDLVGGGVRDIPYYGLLGAEIGGCSVVVSQSGFSGEKGYEIYLRDATLHAERLWSAVLEAGKPHQLMVIAPGHQRRIQAGILSWGQDMDHETVPFQCNLAYQVPRRKKGDYIGRAALERMRAEIEAGRPPFKMILVGMRLGGKPIDDYAPDFWLVSDAGGGDPIGYLTSPWHAPEIGCNIALGYVPLGRSAVGTELRVWLPDDYASEPGRPDPAWVCEVPFRPSVNPSARERAHARGEDAAD